VLNPSEAFWLTSNLFLTNQKQEGIDVKEEIAHFQALIALQEELYRSHFLQDLPSLHQE